MALKRARKTRSPRATKGGPSPAPAGPPSWVETILQQQQQLQAAMIGIMEKSQGSTSGGIDRKSIGGPPEWDSTQEHGFLEWQIKLTAWLVNQDERAMEWLKMARDSAGLIETDDLDRGTFQSEQLREKCKKLNAMLYNILVTKLKGEAFNIVTSARDGCGYEGL